MADEKSPFELLDLRHLCRDSDKLLTTVRIYHDYRPHIWVKLGQIRLRRSDNLDKPGWELMAYLANATDFEHDSAFVFSLKLIGVEFHGEAISYGQTHFTGFIRADLDMYDSFNVPDPGYNPLELPDTTICKQCEDGEHPIVPEGYYVPPNNPALYKLVRGRRIEVITGLKP